MAAESRVGEESFDPIELELFTHRFSAIVRQMGEALRRTAVSVNVKERLDFSCALLDSTGRLVVNAPHIPVHLGALGLCVRRVAEVLTLGPGDVAITNHPAFGGSHLPDVTVITPLYWQEPAQGDSALLGYLASRAHHAEIGGIRPGSMPPSARCLAEEGVVLRPDYLIRRGGPRWDLIREALQSAPYPSRAVDENLADLAAAVAANQYGLNALSALADAYGAEKVLHNMKSLARVSNAGIQSAFRSLGTRRLHARQDLDDGTPLVVSICLEEGKAVFDFSGSGETHRGNLNATPAVVRSAVLYVLRLLISEPLPLNEGLLEQVELIVPEGILNPVFHSDPRLAPAVVGGNVETSQRLVDTLLQAFDLVACSQGTMNNVVFGNERFGFYETVCGGCGAGPGFAGASAVHSHMTNTAITDVEIMEHRYPVRIRRFELRRGSGGTGRWRGGDGVVREFEFLEPVSLSILGQHRNKGPYGAHGGGAGSSGRQTVVRVGGSVEELAGVDERELAAGDRFILETPGGGGWGIPGEGS